MKAALIFPLLPIAVAVSLVSAGVPNSREAEWRVPEILQALGLQPGQTVADIGCGDGFLTVRLAPLVGAEGKVFAVDIDDGALAKLRRRVAEAGARNVEIVRGREADPLLAPASVDAVVILRAYHEFSRHGEMLAKIRAALRPGGRLVIADVAPGAGDGDASRESQVARHVLEEGIVAGEMVEAGFLLVSSRPQFARLKNGEIVWLLAGVRPPGGVSKCMSKAAIMQL